MGCGFSKGFQNVDDSVRVIIAHDKKVKKQKGLPDPVYKPHSALPMMQSEAINTPTKVSFGVPADGNDTVATEE